MVYDIILIQCIIFFFWGGGLVTMWINFHFYNKFNTVLLFFKVVRLMQANISLEQKEIKVLKHLLCLNIFILFWFTKWMYIIIWGRDVY